jgi:UDP-2,4-diacetamido-2,4,6-trideoxy-beta-L-altropyranose hydrolase
MHVVFRVDASIQIGTGHVMRCLTLADELSLQGHKCWFICREHQGHLGDVIINKGYSLSLLQAPTASSPQQKACASDDYARWLGVPWEEDAHQTLDVILPLKPDWLVVDHYALDAQWERKLSSAVSKIMVIDDLANRAHECILLLDQNLGRVTEDYQGLLLAECQRLIGPRYALLRPEFAALRDPSLLRRKHPKVKRILISLGGVDRTNVTGRVLTALADSSLPASTELDIIMGTSAPYLDEVRQQAAQLPFEAKVSVDVQDMAERMYLADLSIGAAGSTSWERCCLGLPSVTVILAENQRVIAEALAEYQAGLLIDTEQIMEELSSLIEIVDRDSEMLQLVSQKAAQVCDGNGANFVVSAFTGEVV